MSGIDSITRDVSVQVIRGARGVTVRFPVTGVEVPAGNAEEFIGNCAAQPWEPAQFDLTDEEFQRLSSLPKKLSIRSPRDVNNCIGTGTATLSGGPGGETEVEMIPPQGYDRWEPQASEDEKAFGNDIDIGIVAHKKGAPDKEPPIRVLKYKIELEGTSREKGVDLNWPPQSKATDDFDMKIDKDNPWIKLTGDVDKGQSAETKQTDLTQFTVTVNSYDWGGWTKLRVTAELEGKGGAVVAHVRGHPDQESLAIPKDDNSNHIADWWEHWFDIKNPDASADDDDTPLGDGQKGDSIALYDEYRGFHIHGRHERLSPEIKDLFVWDQDNIGTGIYGTATGISVHLVYGLERFRKGGDGNPFVVTPNGSHGDTYAIWLHSGSIGDGGVGDTAGGPSVPSSIQGITIDTNLITAAYGAQAAPELQSTIAHELGHATNVWHHGDGPDYSVGDARCRRPDGSVQNFLCSTKPKGAVGGKGGGCFEVAVKGGLYSGNDNCMMRYDMTNFYEDPAGNCQWSHGSKTVVGSLYGQDPPGMAMCDNPRGTGVNDPSNPHNKAGDATPGRGDCAHKLRLKNGAH